MVNVIINVRLHPIDNFSFFKIKHKMFKAFTTRLSKKRRTILKNKVFLASCTIFHVARKLFALSCKDCTDIAVHNIMEGFITSHVDDFLRRCRRMTKTQNEKNYVRSIVKKHIMRIINYSFDEHIRRLNDADTISILNNNDSHPRFYYSTLIETFKKQQRMANKKLLSQII